jgi:hypothetical protein
MISALMPNHSQPMQGIGMIRVNRQNMAVPRFGFGQTPRLMSRLGGCQSVAGGDGHGQPLRGFAPWALR